MESMWNQKYAGDDFFYGKAPNQFFKEYLGICSPGSILLPGDGEGRNAVYAAKQDWDVTAFDLSSVGRKKALALARAEEVNINFTVDNFLDYKAAKRFDMVGLFYTHVPPEVRKPFHKKVQEWLKPSGTLIMEVFEKKQFMRPSGGPKDLNLLYSEIDLLKDFEKMKIIKSESVMIELDEGPAHQGEAYVVRLILKKDK